MLEFVGWEVFVVLVLVVLVAVSSGWLSVSSLNALPPLKPADIAAGGPAPASANRALRDSAHAQARKHRPVAREPLLTPRA